MSADRKMTADEMRKASARRSQKKYSGRWIKVKTVGFHIEKDADLLEFLIGKSFATWVKQKIKEEIKNQG